MDCRDIEQLLSVKQAAELTSEQRVAVADHMWQCATCRMRWNLDVTNADSQADAPSDHGPEGAIVRRRGEDEEQSTSIDGEVGPPRNLGGFEILGRLGRGGMATVFRVRQRSMDRIVALKVLMGHTGWSEASLMRFTREAQTAAAAGHPNIIEVYDTGHDRGWYYIAMEYMDGGSLADVLQRDGPLAPERALALMKQVAGGLAEAHRMGILHRDIKPSNILLTSRGWAKVADFGLAKRPDIDLSVTRSALLLGTPVYMAPEALRGAEYDARCDLYSLGATFYQTLAGQPPFMGRTSTELVAKHLEAQPAPLTEVSPGTPPPLARIVHRLLEKKPSDRYQSAGDLLSALEGVSLPAASCLETSQLAELFRIAGEVMGVDLHATPTSFEASPTTLTAELMSLLAVRSVDRLSVGVQSFSPRECKTLGRPQAPEEVHRGLQLAREAGPATLNIDLMYGIPGQARRLLAHATARRAGEHLLGHREAPPTGRPSRPATGHYQVQNGCEEESGPHNKDHELSANNSIGRYKSSRADTA